MPLQVTLYNSIDEVPANDWAALSADDLSLDPRLLRVLELTASHEARFWYVVIRDSSSRPAAIAALCRYSVDALETTSPRIRTMIAALRKLSPNLLRFGVLFCGLPVPSGACHLKLAPETNSREVLTALDLTLDSLARKTRSRLITLKEFPAAEVLRGPIGRLGYLTGDIPPAYVLDRSFTSFDEYLTALRSTFRRQISSSIKKGAELETTLLTGDAAADAFTPEIHAMYLAVRDRAKYRMETLTREFFCETFRAFENDASLLVLSLRDRPVGFSFGLTFQGIYHNLYVGLDYEANAEADVYFNLYHQDLARAFASGAREMHLGQTSDAFKQRLGARAEPLVFYVRAVSPLVQFFLRRFSRLAFPSIEVLPPKQVWKDEAAAENQRADQADLSRR